MPVADFYGRKSTLDDGRSIEGQADDYAEDCDEEGLEPGLHFQDPDRSASRFAKRDRPDYDALVAHIASGQCQMISLWESSRGGRDLGPWIAFLDLCRKTGTLIRVISHKRTYDIRNRRDWRTLAEDGINSADESELISERVKRGKRKAARLGRAPGRLAYGFARTYDERGNFLAQVAHPEQAPIVEEIIKGFDEGKLATAIARDLNQRGVPVPQQPCPDSCRREHRHFPPGMVWSHTQVRAIALKPSYAGQRVYQAEVIGNAQWEPLVDPAMWQRVHDKLTSTTAPPHNSTLSNWLTGAVHCGLCGGLVKATKRGKRSKYLQGYACRNCRRVSATAYQLEAFIESALDGRFALADTKPLWVPQADNGAVQAAADELEALERRLEEFRAEGRKPRGLSAAAVAEAEHGLAPLIEEARAKLKALTVPAPKDLAAVDISRWKEYSVRIRRDLLRAVAHVVLAPGVQNGRKAFDPLRLAGSRWTGETITWGDRWQAEGLAP